MFLFQRPTRAHRFLFAGALLASVLPSSGNGRADLELRTAINKAPLVRGIKRIYLEPGIYHVAPNASKTPIIVNNDLTIIGNVANTIIDGTGLGNHIFEVQPHVHLTLINVTIRRSHAAATFIPEISSPVEGGAIFNFGFMKIIGCTLERNSTAYFTTNDALFSGSGGAIFNVGTLIMQNCIVQDNNCGIGARGGSGSGGGICNIGSAFLKHCIICNNSADGGGFGVLPPDHGGSRYGGGGVFNTGNMEIEDCFISDNFAGGGQDKDDQQGQPPYPGPVGGNGGGVFNAGSMLIRNSSIIANFSGFGGRGVNGGRGGHGGNGAGLFNGGFLALESSQIQYNHTFEGGTGGTSSQNSIAAGDGGAGGDGGGIYNLDRIEMKLCTIAGNQSGLGGLGGEVLVATVLPGSAPAGNGGNGGAGGGLYNAGTLTSVSCTIADNYSGQGGYGGFIIAFGVAPGATPVPGNGANAGNGAGVYNEENASCFLANTIVAQNRLNIPGGPGEAFISNHTYPTGQPGSPGFGPDYEGALESGGFNLIGIDDGTGGFTNRMTTDLIGSPNSPIDPLFYYYFRDPAPVYYLDPTSPAIDNGNSFGLTTDEIGRNRVHDDPAVPNASGGDGSDIGAVEMQ